MAQEKEKPTVETVQQEVKASDLLMYEVCAPLKEQLDEIKVCTPSIPVCMPNDTCHPTLCLPVVSAPCGPTLLCGPTTSRPSGPQLPPNLLRQKLLVSDLEQLNATVQELKKDIATLKSKK